MPDGYTEEEVLEIVEVIADRFSQNRKFDIFSREDVKQEIYLMCLTEGLARYDKNRGAKLNTFLTTFVNCRTKILRRDKYYDPNGKFAEQHAIVKNPERLSAVKEDQFNKGYLDDYQTEIDIVDLQNDIDTFLPIKQREIYSRMLNGYNVDPDKRKEVEDTIQEYLDDRLKIKWKKEEAPGAAKKKNS